MKKEIAIGSILSTWAGTSKSQFLEQAAERETAFGTTSRLSLFLTLSA
jgi:hypothetical protein